MARKTVEVKEPKMAMNHNRCRRKCSTGARHVQKDCEHRNVTLYPLEPRMAAVAGYFDARNAASAACPRLIPPSLGGTA